MNIEEKVTENVEIEEVNPYIEQIKALKANSVDKSAYEKLQRDNKQLLDTLCNGGVIQQAQPQKVLRDYNEIGKELATADYLTAKEFLALSEELREAMIAQKGVDPWFYHGDTKYVDYTDDDYNNLEAIEQFVEHMHEFDDADKEHYVAEVNRLTPQKKQINKVKGRF